MAHPTKLQHLSPSTGHSGVDLLGDVAELAQQPQLLG
jgi:hypothetical protein